MIATEMSAAEKANLEILEGRDDAMVEAARQDGFFNPELLDSGSWAEESEWKENASKRTVSQESALTFVEKQEALYWGCWVLRFKEWHLLGKRYTPLPESLEVLRDQYEELYTVNYEVWAQAGEIAEKKF